MTEEEAALLDELYTKNPPNVDPGRPGFFAQLKAKDEEQLNDIFKSTAPSLSDKLKAKDKEEYSDIKDEALAAGQ